MPARPVRRIGTGAALRPMAMHIDSRQKGIRREGQGVEAVAACALPERGSTLAIMPNQLPTSVRFAK